MKERDAGGGEDHTWYDPRLGGGQLQAAQQEDTKVLAHNDQTKKLNLSEGRNYGRIQHAIYFDKI